MRTVLLERRIRRKNIEFFRFHSWNSWKWFFESFPIHLNFRDGYVCIFIYFCLTGRLDNDENDEKEGEKKFLKGDYTRRNPSLIFSSIYLFPSNIYFFLTQKMHPLNVFSCIYPWYLSSNECLLWIEWFVSVHCSSSLFNLLLNLLLTFWYFTTRLLKMT